jgi:uncharacterized protein (TIGR02246 family)
MSTINEETLTSWLARYGAAWESRDADGAAALFTDDAVYQETPFAEPFHGRDGIHDYWSRVTADQSDVSFEFATIATAGATGIAQWSARFRSISGDAPVELNGVFVLEFADSSRVSSLREWWHVR